MISTTNNNQSNQHLNIPFQIKPWAVFLWLAIWQIASQWIGEPILLVSPIMVIKRLFELILTASFWYSILFSLSRIATGFFCGVLIGSLLAVLSYRYKYISELLTPLILITKTIPVASFIILVLIWVPSKNLSVLISFIMVLPIIYTNVFSGIASTDKELLEMAQVFSLSSWKKIRYIYLSQILPFFQSACSLGLGLCWKAGIAAEVIGIPTDSIGEKLYNAKIYINTADLFAWTIVIIIISIFFEKLILALLYFLVKHLERTS